MNLLISLFRIALLLVLVSSFEMSLLAGTDLGGRHSQVGSLAGAAHLLNNNAGVQRGAQ